MSSSFDIEGLLRDALAPVEPPEELGDRLVRALSQITEVAAEELSDWELAAMSDPRNWVKPAAAVTAGSVAGVALILLRARRRHRHQPGNELSAALAHLLEEGRKSAQRSLDAAIEKGSKLRNLPPR